MQHTILILDDDQATLDMFTEMLTDEGYAVHAFRHTDNIFSLIENIKPIVIIVDFLLGTTNGGELCAQVKKSPRTCNIPVIIMSGFEKVLKSLGDYHCDAFFSKPLDFNKFLNYLENRKTT